MANKVSLTKTGDDQFEATFKLSGAEIKKLGVALNKYKGMLAFTDLGPLTSELRKLIEEMK